jgi:hypothetical protein
MSSEKNQDFSQQAASKQRGPLAEMLSFLLHNKKWWLTPIIVLLLGVGVLVILGASGVAPFIYTLF